MDPTPSEDLIPQYSRFYKLVRMVRAMLAFEPVMANIIAISLGLVVLLLLNYPILFPKLGKYHLYLTYAIYALITMQIIRSASKSLLIPFMAMAIAGVGYLILFINPGWHFFSSAILKHLMLLGVIGVATGIFVIR